jgi:ribosome-binding protein aMBF1 (putative translation factor)
MINQYDITDPRTRPCEFCDQEANGRVRVELYGGGLMVCMACYELLHNSQSKPYSRVMDKFSMRSTGHHASIKKARWTDYMARIGR